MSISPQFFDIFGIIAFVYIVALSAAVLAGRHLPRWTFLILLLIGLAGLIVDGSIVYISYLK